ncbi:TolC family protein [Thiobacter aerophilum]|uniref:TolC family protein n=1 Tax=Thiobacter aerophilum TaxID=3121275 RepID=A0ABV0EGD2_9BURK
MKRACLLSLTLIVATAHAAEELAVPDLPPPSVVRQVLERVPSVVAARAGIGMQEATRKRLLAGPHETVVRVTGQERDVRAAPTAQYREWDLAVERTLRLPGKAALDGALGEQGVTQARLALGDALHEAARSLLKGWFAWLKERSQAALWEEQVALLQQQLVAVDKRIHAGDAPRLERLAAQAALAQAEANRAQARFRAQAAATELMRRFPGLTLPDAVQIAQPRPVEFDGAYWREEVLAHNHELAAAQAETRRARLALTRAEAERIPDPTVGVRAARERGGEEHIIGLTLTVPLGGAARAAAVDASRAEADMAAQREAVVAAKLAAEAENLFHGAQAAYAAAMAQASAAREMEAAAALAARAYALGEGGLSGVLTARRLALEARLAASLATLEANEARYRLLLDAHRLWAIDPDEHDHAPKQLPDVPRGQKPQP